jgi:hypothetical protein
MIMPLMKYAVYIIIYSHNLLVGIAAALLILAVVGGDELMNRMCPIIQCWISPVVIVISL